MTETKTQIRPGTVAFMGEKGGAPGRSFKQFIDMVYADETLSPKVRELIFIGIQTAMDIEARCARISRAPPRPAQPSRKSPRR